MAAARRHAFVEKVLKKLYTSAQRGQGKSLPGTPPSPEEEAAEKVACQSAPLQADEGTSGCNTGTPPGKRLYTVSLPPEGFLLSCGPGSLSSSSSEAEEEVEEEEEASADQDYHDQPKRRRIRKRRSKKTSENHSSVPAEQAESSEQPSLSWEILQPRHIDDGPALSRNKKRKLKKKRQMKRKKAAGLLTGQTSGVCFLYQPEEGSSEPEAADEADGPAQELKVGTAAQEPELGLEPEVGTEAQEPELGLEPEVGTEAQEPELGLEPEVGTEAQEPELGLEPEVGTEAQEPELGMEPEVGTETQELELGLELKVGTAAQEPELGLEPEVGTAAQKPEVSLGPDMVTEAQEPELDLGPEVGTETQEEGFSRTGKMADDILTFLKSTKEMYFYDGATRDSETSVSMESAAQLLKHLETHRLPCSDVLVLDYMKTLVLLEDTTSLKRVLGMFPEHCLMPPDHVRVISAFFTYWITDILPQKTSSSRTTT